MIARPGHRRALLLIVVALLVAAALAMWWFLGRTDSSAGQTPRATFIETCKQQGRIANGGGQMRMDDATEEGLDLYCSCVADHFDQALSESEIKAVGDGTAGQETLAKLNNVVNTCQAEHLVPKGDQPAPAN